MNEVVIVVTNAGGLLSCLIDESVGGRVVEHDVSACALLLESTQPHIAEEKEDYHVSFPWPVRKIRMIKGQLWLH